MTAAELSLSHYHLLIMTDTVHMSYFYATYMCAIVNSRPHSE